MPDVTYAPERPRDIAVGPNAAARPLRRRSPLPSGRAVVGGFLVALAALGIFAAYTRATQGPATSYVVARTDLAPGDRITADHLALLPMELPGVVARQAAFTGTRPLVGATVVGPVGRGELVQASDVVRKRSGPDELEVSFSLETARAVAGTLRSGERVDVLATFGTGTASYTTAIVRHARVLEAEGGSGALGDSRNETVTLAVTDPQEALAVTHAVNVGEVTLVRSTGTTAPAAGPPPVYVAPAARDEGGG